MFRYIVHRVLVMIPTLLVISAVVFAIIQLPPGDYVTSYIEAMRASGETVDESKVQFLREYYGLDDPLHEQYLTWIGGLMEGDLGHSFAYDLPVNDVIGDRLLLTVMVSVATIIVAWVIAFPIGIYSATHQYSWGDYGLSFLGFVGLATPNFLLALVLMFLAQRWFGTSIGGLMDPEYINEPMSWDKFVSILEHLLIPAIVVGTAGTASLIRRLRANLLDELQKQYVVTGRAKGLPPFRLLTKYPLRMSLNFFIADVGSLLPTIISGAEVVAIVMGLQTTGPMFIAALQSQDMYLAGTFLMFLASLTVVGMLISDLALAMLDPRIRLQGGVNR